MSERVTIAGAGRLGGAVIEGLLGAGVPRGQIAIVQRPGPRFEAWAARGFAVRTDFSGPAPDLVLVSVKPRALPAVIGSLQASELAGTPVVSLASGMSLAGWRAALGERFPVLRARANVLVAAGHGNVLLAGSAAAAVEALALRVLGRVGKVVRVGEADMVAHTWFSSSLPIVGVSRLLLDGLASEESPERRALAEALAAEALIGLGEHLRRSARAAAAAGEAWTLSAALRGLIEEVATPGGMNAAALELLERRGLPRLLAEARETYLSHETSNTPKESS